MNKEKLLDAVKLTGEGKGRLTLGNAQYVFGVDSVLNENHDWIMAVQIPLHGEEVMILPDLKQAQIANQETESFELRIASEFKRLGLHKELSSEDFMKEMRSLIRFVLSPQWGRKRDCVAQGADLACKQDGEIYLVKATDKLFLIEKTLNKKFILQVVAKNLSKPFFTQTDILLHSNSSESLKKASAFSMEFFW